MAIPDYQGFMLPLLRMIADGGEYPVREIYQRLSDEFDLTPEERAELLPSGGQPLVENRIGWAKTYLKKAGLIDYPKRGVTQISLRGKEVLSTNPSSIDTEYLKRFDEFRVFQTVTVNKRDSQTNDDKRIIESARDDTATPTEAIETAHQRLHQELASDLLDTIQAASPAFFERLVVDLMIKMGYGGSRREAGEATKLSGDGGVDGIIREDRLGLDTIYLQAKRWEGVVGRPEIQKFAGALQGFRAKKGVFITTSHFTKEAREYVDIIDSKIVLIDGERLANLMIDYGVGVSTKQVFEVKQLDSDYFAEE